MRRSHLLGGIGYGAAAFVGAMRLTSAAASADVVNPESVKLLPIGLQSAMPTLKLATLDQAKITMLLKGGRFSEGTSAASMATDPGALTPAAAKLNKGDLNALSDGRVTSATSNLSVGDIASIKLAFARGSVMRGGGLASDGISSCCCTPCCCAATNDLSTFARSA